ncbi:TPA: hypothetical protein ACPVXZ_003889 [Vibrio parahaemolyticus]|nr:hypothetical protein [Vibrio parahaemolyticus]EGR1699745.1 hypothetical protein [Vibrio parahaemolyticus]MDF4404632.1 hypothetical protein [Vibrio parahaemolyticus]MDF4608537.1 hypothetical protein [Vibrio parahaemolyticus]OQU33464.1 hypothetical protein EN05_004410 [Vibrio parahaemolyticus]
MARRKTCLTAFFTAFKLAKNTGFELEQQRQRNNTKEIVRKLETVNDELKTKTSHLVPPE